MECAGVVLQGVWICQLGCSSYRYRGLGICVYIYIYIRVYTRVRIHVYICTYKLRWMCEHELENLSIGRFKEMVNNVGYLNSNARAMV